MDNETPIVVDFADEGKGSAADAASFLKTLEHGTAAKNEALAKPEPARKSPPPASDSDTGEDDLVESERKPEAEAPAEEETQQTEPGDAETPEAGPDDGGNPKLYADRFDSVDKLEHAYKESQREHTRRQEQHASQARELEFKLAEARQQLAQVTIQRPPTWEQLSDKDRDYYEYHGAQRPRPITGEALFELDLAHTAHQAEVQQAKLAELRETARTQFIAAIDALPQDEADHAWDTLEETGVDWRGLFETVAPETALTLGNKLLEATRDRRRLEKENAQLKAGREQIALEAKHEGITQARQSIGHKKRSGTEAARAQSIPQKAPGERQATSSLIDELLAYDRDKSRFDVVRD